jgi:hypothetical protein
MCKSSRSDKFGGGSISRSKDVDEEELFFTSER